MKTIILILFLSASVVGFSQTAPPPDYGAPITLETAKKIAAASEAYAKDKKWPVVIVIVDSGSNIVLIHKIDNTQIGSIDVAIGKARTANNFKRSTKVFEDAIAGGSAGARVLSLPNAVVIDGGEPIIVDGKIIGAIGVSGVQSAQDAEVAKAGIASLNK